MNALNAILTVFQHNLETTFYKGKLHLLQRDTENLLYGAAIVFGDLGMTEEKEKALYLHDMCFMAREKIV